MVFISGEEKPFVDVLSPLQCLHEGGAARSRNLPVLAARRSSSWACQTQDCSRSVGGIGTRRCHSKSVPVIATARGKLATPALLSTSVEGESGLRSSTGYFDSGVGVVREPHAGQKPARHALSQTIMRFRFVRSTS